MKSPTPANGFSLVELMIVITVLGVLVSVAAPSFSKLIKDSQMTAAVNDTVGALQLARSESIRLGKRVNVEPLDNDINIGLRVYVDTTTNGYDAGEELREVRYSQGSLGVSATGPTSFSYNPNGTTSIPVASAHLLLAMCDDRSGDIGRTINLLRTGVIRVQKNQTCT